MIYTRRQVRRLIGSRRSRKEGTKSSVLRRLKTRRPRGRTVLQAKINELRNAGHVVR